MNGIVFLDRDGVINHLVERDGKLVSPRNIGDFKIHNGVFEAILKLKKAGFQIVVVTNQPDISRKKMLQSDLNKMTEKLLDLGIDKIMVCPHSDKDYCHCRKPKPGMLLEHLRSIPNHPRNLWMIGDNASDISTGKSVGAKTILIESGERSMETSANFRSSDLRSAVEIIIA
jgi:D-glycero-D-manno-heptose 1,7-bisphosphate phosphatase